MEHTVPRVGVVIEDGDVREGGHPAPGADLEKERSERSERESDGGRARIRSVRLGDRTATRWATHVDGECVWKFGRAVGQDEEVR